MNLDELWSEIRDFPNYAVSNLGRVKNVTTGKILKPSTVRYANVTFTKGRKNRFTKTVHGLVAEAFLGPRPVGYEVNHKDGNKLNNLVTNLEFVTKNENALHSFRTGLQKPSGGVAKVSIRIVETGEIFPSIADAARHINGFAQNVGACLKGRVRSVRGYTFEVVD